MLAFMPPSESANSSPGVNFWYGSGSLPDAFEGLSQEGSNPRMTRRASEAVIHPAGFYEQGPGWDPSQTPLHIDNAQLTGLAIRSQSISSPAKHNAPLAPKRPVNAKNQHQSPISGTYALRTFRGKITSIACESCRKRKSKCDGVRPRCNTCQSKNLSCIYDVGKTTRQLRAHVRRLAKELDDTKSIISLLTMAPDRAIAANWASELEKNGFAHHSAEEIKKSLQVSAAIPKFRFVINVDRPNQPQHDESFGPPGNEPFPHPVPGLAASSYGGSQDESNHEQNEPTMNFPMETPVEDGSTFNFNSETHELSKFIFDCTFYRRTKREMLANGWEEAQIFGRNDVDVETILLGFMDPHYGQPVPTWASRTVNKLLPTTSLPVRLASTCLFTKMMRWFIWPSVENMNAMPEWLMPLTRQDCSAYDLLVDLLPWPQLRQYLYQYPEEFAIGAFLGFVGINWPYADDACHYWDIEAASTRLTPLFESHVNNLNSWTLDPKAFEQ